MDHPSSHDDPAPALTFGQVAARMRVDVQTVRRWVRTEQCPTVRVGHATRIPAAWADDPKGWLDRW